MMVPPTARWVKRLLFTGVSMVVWSGGSTSTGYAQGTRADYERAAHLEEFARSRVATGKVVPHWFQRDNAFWYRDERPEGHTTFYVVDTFKGQRVQAFDHTKLAQFLGKALGKPFEAEHLPFRTMQFAEDGEAVNFSAEGRFWRFGVKTGLLRQETGVVGQSVDVGAIQGSLHIQPTIQTGDPAELTIVNRMPAEVKIKWINFGGEPISYTALKPGDSVVESTYSGHRWLVADPSDKTLAVFETPEDGGVAIVDPANLPKPEVEQPAPIHAGTRSPDGRWLAFVREGNVWLFDAQAGREEALTQDAKPGDEYEADVSWSPDSRYLAAKRTEAAQEHRVHFVESSPRDQIQPKLLSEDYLKPGDRIAHPRVHLFQVLERNEVPVDDRLCPNPWSITELHWSTDSQLLTFTYNQRGHQIMRIVGVEARTGSVCTVLEETSRTFIDYSGKHYLKYLDGSGEFIWMSERDGWNHLYLYDAKTGSLKNRITRGPWVVRGVDRVDEKARQIWFRAGGINPGQNPCDVHYCRVNFDGKSAVVLTPGNGDHSVEFSPDRKVILDTWSRVDQPPVTELRRAEDGKLLCEVSRGDWTELLKTGWSAPVPFVAKGRDGITDIWGVIFRPMRFNPLRKYPVIEDIYAGPQSSHAPRKFQPSYGEQKLAELGFVVVKIDGMGTSERSKAFHDVCWKNLQDAGLPDRILWMKAAATKFPAMDLSQVGIYGGSAGGQNALGALLFHGGFYKVGWADCGCHDNRMDKIWWNEQWMGWPVGPQYVAASNVTHASQLQGKLMLVVGELDHNVDPASTMQVVDALIKADKDFDLLVVPGADHGAGGSPYGQRRMYDFFVRNLLGVEPRAR